MEDALKLDTETIKEEVDALVVISEDQAIATEADAMVEKILAPEKLDREDLTLAVEDMGRNLQRDAAHRSALLQEPIKDLAKHSEDGGPVASALIDLKMQVEDLDPNKFDFQAGWLARILGSLPGVGTPMKRYFSKFESAQTAIDATVRSLEGGRDQLRRDNTTLAEDERALREVIEKLSRQINLGMQLDNKLQYKLDREIEADDPRRAIVEEGVLFPLRQRIIDLQQQQTVAQQGVLSIATIIGNNRELMRGVNRALDVTISALQTAVATATALTHQKIVLDKIDAVNKTTSDLIAGTAERLKTQGAAIHKQASSSMLDMNSLKSAWADITAAMDDIQNYRREALPQMAQTILEFEEMSRAGEREIEKLDSNRSGSSMLKLEVE